MQNSRSVKQGINPEVIKAQRIQIAQDYIKQLQMGEEQKAEILLQEINQQNSQSPNQDLYTKVGLLTRELHDSISRFMNDTRIHMMTNEDMPDARQRLQHVVDLTEQSAHTTMTLIEHSNPLLSQMKNRAGILQQQLHADINKQQVNGINHLNEEIEEFLNLVLSSSKNITNDLNEIMLAQNYQDLTGQIIQRVSTLVQEVEDNLLALLQQDNEHMESQKARIELATENNMDEQNNKGHGPAIPGISHGGSGSNIVNSQEEVDDLLSSLGF